MKAYVKLLLALTSGLLLTAGWPEHGFPGILFVAFIPLMLIERAHWKMKEEIKGRALFPYSFLTFLVFNILTTYWIYNASAAGAIAAIFLNSLFMTLVFQVFHLTHRRLKWSWTGYLGLVVYWLSFELLHLNWDLNWPWLNLGNGFAAFPSWIQWYEYTGIFGGSLWVLLVNILLLHFAEIRFIQKICSRQVAVYLFSGLALILVPIIFSLFIYKRYSEKADPVEIVAVQPNLDPYSEQYELDPLDVSGKMLDLATQKSDSLTRFIIFPESALQEYADEEYLDNVGSIMKFRTYLLDHKNLTAVVGMSTRRIFGDGESRTPTARKFSNVDKYYDAYNTALMISPDGSLQVHHKSKLTPGVEKMPYPRVFRFLENYAIDLGGTVGSLGIENEHTPFVSSDHIRIAPIICYESVYGEFVNDYVKKGANLIFVITNDGWWGNTPGHRQHLLFSSLRAIETRRSVARSANTGISCFINQRGDILQRTAYWEPCAIKATLNANDKTTFYVRYGDYIGRASVLVMAIMLLVTLTSVFSGFIRKAVR